MWCMYYSVMNDISSEVVAWNCEFDNNWLWFSQVKWNVTY